MTVNTLERRSTIVQLAGGPCDGAYVTVASYDDDCWQRLSRGEQVWCQYVKNLYHPGEFVWSGQALTTSELGERIQRDKTNTYGQSEGA